MRLRPPPRAAVPFLLTCCLPRAGGRAHSPAAGAGDRLLPDAGYL